MVTDLFTEYGFSFVLLFSIVVLAIIILIARYIHCICGVDGCCHMTTKVYFIHVMDRDPKDIYGRIRCTIYKFKICSLHVQCIPKVKYFFQDELARKPKHELEPTSHQANHFFRMAGYERNPVVDYLVAGIKRPLPPPPDITC